MEIVSLRTHILQNQYVILSVGSGLAMILIITMTFLMLKRKRQKPYHSQDNVTSIKYMIEYIPCVLILSWISITLYGLIMVIHNAIVEPNW